MKEKLREKEVVMLITLGSEWHKFQEVLLMTNGALSDGRSEVPCAYTMKAKSGSDTRKVQEWIEIGAHRSWRTYKSEHQCPALFTT